MNKIKPQVFFSVYLSNKKGIYFYGKEGDVSFPETGYDGLFKFEDNSFWFKHRNNCILSVIKTYSKNNLFFDVGGGNGKVASYLQENNIPVVMIEAGKAGVCNAQKRGVKNLVCANFSNLLVKDNIMPAIGMFDVLEHIEDDMGCLHKIYKSLVPGGYYFITVPAYQQLWSQDDIDAGHFRRYTIGKLQKKLETVGFQIDYATYFFQYLPVPIICSRVLLYKLGLNKDKHLQTHAQEHTAKGMADKITSYFHKREICNILNNKVMNFGGSVLVAAKKR